MDRLNLINKMLLTENFCWSINNIMNATMKPFMHEPTDRKICREANQPNVEPASLQIGAGQS